MHSKGIVSSVVNGNFRLLWKCVLCCLISLCDIWETNVLPKILQQIQEECHLNILYFLPEIFLKNFKRHFYLLRSVCYDSARFCYREEISIQGLLEAASYLTIPVGFRIEVEELLLDAQLSKPQHTNNSYLCKYFVLYFLIIWSLPLSKFDLYIRFYISFRYIVLNYYSHMKVLLTNMQFILNLISTDRFIIISVPMEP